MKDTRLHILDSAFYLFLQKSFKEVTMQEIVKKTGLSKGAFYHHFKSKEELFREVLRRFFLSMIHVDYNHFSQESLYDFYHELLDYMSDRQVEMSKKVKSVGGGIDYNYYHMIFDALKLFPDFREKASRSGQGEVKAWTKVIQSAIDRGEIKARMSATQIARLFIYASDGVGMRLIMAGRMDRMKKEMTNIWDDLYNQLKK